MKIKLSKWAKNNSLTYSGAYKLFKSGGIPGAEQLESGTILVEELNKIACKVKCEKTGRSFEVTVGVDLGSSGLSDIDKADILSSVAELGRMVAEKIGYMTGTGTGSGSEVKQ